MSHYTVYLEYAADGPCLAHVPDLPCCIVRASSRAKALELLPAALDAHHTWLRRHGEPTPPVGESLTFEIAGEYTDGGPFDPGHTAALLPPDREPLALDEMEGYFRLMAHTRADLLALARDLPDDLLDGQPTPESFSIRRILRHVGNAEEWYVSRLVPPDSLPPKWDDDKDLPLFDFLAMERRTAIARLRQLTEVERSQVSYPTAWTRRPDEPWTARKALRRFLEHEVEHSAQVREVLAAYRCHLLAALAAERAGLLESLLGMNEQALTQEPTCGQWTAKDLLAHIAAWDRWQHKTMAALVAGESPDLALMHDFDASNAAFYAQWQDRCLADVLAEFTSARADWLAWLEGLPLEEFFKRRPYEDDDWSFWGEPVLLQGKHDAEHAAQLTTWQQAHGAETETGEKAILLAAVEAAREELLAAAALVPAEERTTRPVCGDWTLKDVLGHVADWEAFGAEGLRHMVTGLSPQIEYIPDIEAWNQAHAETRGDQPWAQVWADFEATHHALTTTLADMTAAQINYAFAFPWGVEGIAYEWVRVYVRHDREHAHDLREALNTKESLERTEAA